MIKKNFICPCCGLPNHLEFETIEKWEQRQPTDGCAQALLGISSGAAAQSDIEEKIEKLNKVSSKFEDLSFEEWFNKEVVCFIKGKEYTSLDIWKDKVLRLINIEEHFRIPKILKGIELHWETPAILKNIELHKSIDYNLNVLEKQEHWNYNLITRTIENEGQINQYLDIKTEIITSLPDKDDEIIEKIWKSIQKRGD